MPWGLTAAAVVTNGLSTQSLYLAVCVTFSLTMLNSSLNPFLYCWKMREVIQAVKDTIKGFFVN